MCGIVSIFAYHYAAPNVDRDDLIRIRDAMHSRGPDGCGAWYANNNKVALGHRRLSIIDLSEQANQPMISHDQRYVISFNGEIYNYKQLRSNLEKKGYQFKTQSDTEVIIHLYEEHGISMLDALRGMFAFILWDNHLKELFICRDPYGIKPLYYADDGWTVRIASQVKALLTSNEVSKIKDAAGVVGFFLMGSIPEPYTAYQEIRQVPAGSYIKITQLGISEPQHYFSMASIFLEAEQNLPNNLQNIEEEIQAAIIDSVKHHLVADVPVGLFLSSGIDSCGLLGIIKDLGYPNLQTLTLGFEEFKGTHQDEAPLAHQIAEFYQSQHHEYLLTQPEFRSSIQDLIHHMDQPTIDGVNMYFVSKAAADLNWKVALSGLGGDEILGGYPSFVEIPKLVSALKWIHPISFISTIFSGFIQPLNRHLMKKNPKIQGLVQYGGRYNTAYLLKRGLFLPEELKSILNRDLLEHGLNRLSIHNIIGHPINPELKDNFSKISVLESSLYMKNQLLRDSDWAGMAHSLEIRTPLVDKTLLLSIAKWLLLIRQCNKKYLLATTPKKSLPDEIKNRPKSGFTVPISRWLQSDKNIDDWKKIPALTHSNVPWARKWAYTIALQHQLI